jgi:ubiquinone/menaquinone biosynthesis C-methylase UbiE
LDIGAGYGGLSRVLRDRGYTVIATDINVGRAKVISSRGIPYFVSLASNIPIADNAVDAVCLIATLPHLPSPELALKEIGRILKQGGVCVVDFFNIVNLYWRLKFLIGDWESISSRLGWHYFQSTFTKNQFLKIAQKYGLRLSADGSYTSIPKTRKLIHLPIPSLFCVRYSFLLYKV